MNKKEKIGIVLEGGGAKGAYQLGAWKAIRDLNIDYDGVVGTSIGAINAAAMVFADYEEVIQIWKNIKLSKLFTYTEDMDKEDLQRKIISFGEIRKDVDKFLNEFTERKGIDIKPILNLIKENINEELIRNSGKDFGITTYCLSDKRPLELFKEDIPQGMMAEYIFASCYLPIFNAQKINGKYYIDGGYFNNLPINMLVENGYKTIISIRLRPEKYDYSKYKDINIVDICPNEYLSGTLEISKKRSIWMIKQGYVDAYRKLYKRNK